MSPCYSAVLRAAFSGCVLLSACAYAQSSSTSAIPDLSGTTQAASSSNGSATGGATASQQQATPAATTDASATTSDVPQTTPAHPLTKQEEKDLKKKKKEEAKAAKEAEEDKKFLKLQGDNIVAPTLDADGKPIVLQPCSKKDKICQKKRKDLMKRKTAGLKVTNGTITVDGLVGKARLSYDISEVKFLYFSIPGVGTTIVSMQHFPGAIEQKNAFDGATMTVTTPNGHVLALSSDKPLLGHKEPVTAWVAEDEAYVFSPKFVNLGYGSTARAPYNWPGARPLTESEKKMIAKAPPLPDGLAAKQMVLPCQPVKPGEQPKPVKINGVTMTPPACPQPSSAPSEGTGEHALVH